MFTLKINGGALVDKNFKPSECLLGIKKSVCSSQNDVEKLKKVIGETSSNKEKIIDKAKTVLQVETESDIYNHPKVKQILGREAQRILNTNFNPPGPHNSNDWLNNIQLKNKQEQYKKYAPKLYNKKYEYCDFQMRDFAITGGELNMVNMAEISNNYDCFSVIFNTDYSSGGGQHWLCTYCDFTHRGSRDDPYTIEYFDSVGKPPKNEFADWLHKTKNQLLLNNRYAEIIYVPRQQLQYGNSECGVWSLMYIQSRLEGKPPSYFEDNKALDSDMLAFRANLFRWSR